MNTATGEWIIEPRNTGVRGALGEAWRYRRLMPFFAARAMEKLYARTVLGRAWIFLRPLVPIAVSALVFGHLLGLKSDAVPYFLFVLVGTTCWSLFASAVMWGTRSLELNRKVLRKLYVPRVILPLAMSAPALVELAISLALILAAGAYYALTTGQWHLRGGAAAPLALVGAVMSLGLALGIAFFTSVAAATARDVRFTLQYVLGFWFYLTPVLYPLSEVPERWRPLLALNPMAVAIETFKAGVLGIGHVDAASLATALGIVALVFASGLAFFLRAEAAVVDRM